MDIEIRELNPDNEYLYQELLTRTPYSLLYHSIKYRNFLREILGDAKDHYLLAFEGGDLVAAIPAFVKSGPCGAVVNSLPFFGSNGSVVALRDCSIDAKRMLINAFENVCSKAQAITSTIIENPLDRDDELFNDYEADFCDERIGQITTLPHDVVEDEIEDKLMASFHVKTRNLVRKGAKSGFETAHREDKETMMMLHALHQQNMIEIGGLSKPWSVFQAILDNFEQGVDYKIFTARKDGQLAAGLLVFYFNKTAEYFTPVINAQYRSEQPLSYLILHAMKDAVKKECNWWNWGGTWLSQDGVYHFKSRWGTQDYRYKYFIKAYQDIENLKNKSVEDIVNGYPYFYVLPFSEINDS